MEQLKILIVDDAEIMRLKPKLIIQKCFPSVFNIIEAGNGLEAIEKYREFQPNLVLMDIIMPKSSGLQALSVIRILDSNANIVMYSAMGQEAIQKEALLRGARDFIVKPVTKERLVEIITKYLLNE